MKKKKSNLLGITRLGITIMPIIISVIYISKCFSPQTGQLDPNNLIFYSTIYGGLMAGLVLLLHEITEMDEAKANKGLLAIAIATSIPLTLKGTLDLLFATPDITFDFFIIYQILLWLAVLPFLLYSRKKEVKR